MTTAELQLVEQLAQAVAAAVLRELRTELPAHPRPIAAAVSTCFGVSKPKLPRPPNLMQRAASAAEIANGEIVAQGHRAVNAASGAEPGRSSHASHER